ncbi:MAG: hypothetical protein BZ138_07490 [Methanosphaera sp. rholeuAM270]|nr:MAG: hypothetical protein BZ138_07490 [Methanosphaera sp. rholeuAM270]
MFGGSDEYVLREILENVDHILDLHLDLNRNFLELQYANDLKEFELGIIDENEFNQRRNGHYTAIQQLSQRMKK